MNAKQKDQEDARATLRELLRPGDTVYTTLRHVSRSGMSRTIDAHMMQDGEPRWIGRLVARAIGERYQDRQEGVVMTGCGMDMGFELVYRLSYALFGKGWVCIGEDVQRSKSCPSPDHINPGPDRDKYGPTVTHTEGYALRQRWL